MTGDMPLMVNTPTGTPKATPPKATLVFAHGAGAPMDSEFMGQQTAALNRSGIKVIRFEFPYMQQRRQTWQSPPTRSPPQVTGKLATGG